MTPLLIPGVPVASISVDSIFDFSTRMATAASPDWISTGAFLHCFCAGRNKRNTFLYVDPAHTKLEPKTWIVQSRGGENAPAKAFNRVILPQVIQVSDALSQPKRNNNPERIGCDDQ
jgi:hypothetical protein